MLNQISGVRVMSEPWSLFDLHLMFKQKQISLAQHKALLRAALCLQLKQDSFATVSNMVVKLTPHCIAQCPLMKEVLPEANFYFMTRNLKSTMTVSAKQFQCQVMSL